MPKSFPPPTEKQLQFIRECAEETGVPYQSIVFAHLGRKVIQNRFQADTVIKSLIRSMGGVRRGKA